MVTAEKVIPCAQHSEFIDLINDWDFVATEPDIRTRVLRLYARIRQVGAPHNIAVKPIDIAKKRWVIYFIYLNKVSALSQHHIYTLNKLQDHGHSVFVVCACPSPKDVPRELEDYSDALYWKGLGGFDFSAYSLALQEIIGFQKEADIFVMNDSVLGPFCQMDELWTNMRWDLTGFTASHQVENHIQSYAFFLRNFNESKLAHLSKIFLKSRAYDDFSAVVQNQETKFARIASETMTVGANWYAHYKSTLDPSLFAAAQLMDHGFPFLKRSLFTKHSGIVPPDRLKDLLLEHCHPINVF